MYVHTPFPNNVFALDLDNDGKIIWKYEPKQDPSVIPVMCCDTVNRGVQYADGKVFLHQADTSLVALDAKMSFDENALFRRPSIAELRDKSQEDPRETYASDRGLAYVGLDGDIGCIVNGAGLAMATLDMLKLAGGEPANFLDIGGGASPERVTKSFKAVLRDKNVKAILVNVFAGINRCDWVAKGVVDSIRELKITMPVIVRLAGTNVEEGRKIIDQSGLTVISAETLADAASKAVAAAKKAA